MRLSLSLTALALSTLSLPAVAVVVPDAIGAPGEILVATAHAVGSQVYECKADAAGKLTWQFREPIATLFIAGTTVGRHYAGPNWEMTDGSAVTAKVAGRAPASRRGAGQLAGVTTIQRINTRGGVADGTCNAGGAFLSVPYTADYAFYRKRD